MEADNKWNCSLRHSRSITHFLCLHVSPHHNLSAQSVFLSSFSCSDLSLFDLLVHQIYTNSRDRNDNASFYICAFLTSFHFGLFFSCQVLSYFSVAAGLAPVACVCGVGGRGWTHPLVNYRGDMGCCASVNVVVRSVHENSTVTPPSLTFTRGVRVPSLMSPLVHVLFLNPRVEEPSSPGITMFFLPIFI